MFPIRWNFPFRKKNGDVVNIEDAMEGGEPYVLPTATSSRLGGVKIGSGVNVSEDGTISVSGGSKIHVHTFPNQRIVAGGGQLGITVPGEYDLTNCKMFATYGACSSFSKLYTPLINSIDNSTRAVVLHTESSSDPTSAEVILVVIEQ